MINVLQTRLLRLRAAQTLWHKVSVVINNSKYNKCYLAIKTLNVIAFPWVVNNRLG